MYKRQDDPHGRCVGDDLYRHAPPNDLDLNGTPCRSSSCCSSSLPADAANYCAVPDLDHDLEAKSSYIDEDNDIHDAIVDGGASSVAPVAVRLPPAGLQVNHDLNEVRLSPDDCTYDLLSHGMSCSSRSVLDLGPRASDQYLSRAIPSQVAVGSSAPSEAENSLSESSGTTSDSSSCPSAADPSSSSSGTSSSDASDDDSGSDGIPLDVYQLSLGQLAMLRQVLGEPAVSDNIVTNDAGTYVEPNLDDESFEERAVRLHSGCGCLEQGSESLSLIHI